MYSQNHQRDTSGQRIILVGDNDGQLHAFVTDNAYEAWSFIPPDIRNKLYLVAHPAHPTAYDATALTHQYFMDGYTTYSEVWLGTGNGQYKSPSDWHTLLIAGEGRGGNTNLWSQSLYCDANFNATYATSARTPVYYRNYCGYYAFDLTATTLTPQFLWRIGSNTALTTGTNGTAAYLGQPWSKMVMARVIINGNEKWVGFIGGGYSGNNCTSTTCDTRGKGFYVIDLKTGNVLWSYTYGQNNSMAYDLAANPAVVDTDNDGFVDTAYIGDLGGNVWRFTFCPKNNTSCGISNWTGGMFYNAGSGGGQIFHMDAVTKDTSGNLWVYFGTGNETDPTNVPTNGTTDKFFGLIDKNPIVQLPPPSTTPITLGNLKNITSGTFNPATDVNTYSGWVINFTTAGEKVLAEATVFQGSIYFTTYLPGSASDPCNQSGTAYYYAINYVTGAGLFANNARSINIGVGIPSSPIVSVGPTGYISVYASTSASGSSGGPATKSLNIGNPPQTCPISPCPPSPTAGGPKGLLYYWLDKRLQ
jgi:Tfp pilus tip-associated adhesin PilY1